MNIQENVRLVTAKAIAKAEEYSWDWIVENDFVDEALNKADDVLKAQAKEGVVIEIITSSLTFAHKEHAYYGPLIEEK